MWSYATERSVVRQGAARHRSCDAPVFRGPGLCFTNGTTFSPSATVRRSPTLRVRYQRNSLASWAFVNLVLATIAAASSLRLVFSPAVSACSNNSSSLMSIGMGHDTEACLCGQSLTRWSAGIGVLVMGAP